MLTAPPGPRNQTQPQCPCNAVSSHSASPIRPKALSTHRQRGLVDELLDRVGRLIPNGRERGPQPLAVVVRQLHVLPRQVRLAARDEQLDARQGTGDGQRDRLVAVDWVGGHLHVQPDLLSDLR